MNKLLCLLLSLSIFFSFTTTTYATEYTVHDFIEYLEDGSYFTVVIEDENTSSNITLYSTSVTKSKTYTYYNSKGTKQWYVKVTGTFTYGNGTSKCNSSSVSAKSYVNAWKITSKSSSKSGKTAIAKATAKQYYNGTVINTINETVKLTCSSTGKFS